jgi:hypothetical protein
VEVVAGQPLVTGMEPVEVGAAGTPESGFVLRPPLRTRSISEIWVPAVQVQAMVLPAVIPTSMVPLRQDAMPPVVTAGSLARTEAVVVRVEVPSTKTRDTKVAMDIQPLTPTVVGVVRVPVLAQMEPMPPHEPGRWPSLVEATEALVERPERDQPLP